MPLSAGTKLGPYEIIAAIGAGGMGEVYRARDARLDRDVAIKVLPESFAGDADRLRRFEQEARTVAALNHPNILGVYDIGQHQGSPYMVCELLDGETLREKLQEGPMPQRRAIEYASQIAEGLAAAHDKGVVHRDLKPENVFVTRDGRVKVLDFGLAKLAPMEAGRAAAGEGATFTGQAHTMPGMVLGTAGYMSPEQVRGKEVDARTDIFAFGAILYEMLSGRRAFKGESSIETMNAILKDDPPELETEKQKLSPGLEHIVRHCLEKNPEERFRSARRSLCFGKCLAQLPKQRRNLKRSQSVADWGPETAAVISRIPSSCSRSIFYVARNATQRSADFPATHIRARNDPIGSVRG